ncbi:MAG TPA: hypothetical protein VKT32_04765 [Chthonomonadaceae bacterium]|nr:hypothetical protein [Chthonomonadaceae bacterium]
MEETQSPSELPEVAGKEIVVVSAADELRRMQLHAARRRQRIPEWLRALGILTVVVLYPLLPVIAFIRWVVGWGRSLCTCRRRRRLIRLAAEQEDVRAVGPLLWMLKADNRLVKRDLHTALCALLPRMESPAGLSAEEHRAFSTLLRYSQDRQFVRAALEAVGRWRDASPLSLFAVRSLYQGATPAEEETRRRAGEILPLLDQHTRQEDLRTSLLRASMAGSEQQSVLLRAAASGESLAAAEQLLRAIEPPGPDQP